MDSWFVGVHNVSSDRMGCRHSIDAAGCNGDVVSDIRQSIMGRRVREKDDCVWVS